MNTAVVLSATGSGKSVVTATAWPGPICALLIRVTLPDGTQHTVLVPQVYAKVKAGNLTGDGAKKSGLMGTGGIGITLGSSKSIHDLKQKGTTQSQSTSTVGSTAGNVSITSGGHTRVNGGDLIAGKNLSLSGDSVVVTPGHDKNSRIEEFEQKSSGLTLALSGAVGEAINAAVATAQATKQDSDNYNSKQTSVSAGGSFTLGSMTGSGYISASQDKMRSNYDSVIEQSGIYAGKGGFDVTVGNHTQLNGGVIASQGGPENNRLDTGTLGFSDIRNEADYKVSHTGISLSGGGGATLASNAMSNMGNVLAGLNGKGHAEGTTQAAVADGTIIIRDQARQKQDLAELSRDTDHANGSIAPIFDKEKEQKRLQASQLVGEIAGQMATMVNTWGDIEAMKKANANMGPIPEGLSEQERAKEVEKRRSSQYYQDVIGEYGTGSKKQMVVQAIGGVLQGLVNGNIPQSVAGGINPLMAQTIKAYTTNPDSTTNKEANLMAHAVWGAVAAQMSGGNAGAGAAGAFSGELAARYISENYYNARTAEEISRLSESDRQEISLLSTLAAGAAGGLIGDSRAATVTGAQAGKNAVENNSLAGDKARESVKQSAEYWKNQVRDKLGNGTTSAIANSIINAIADSGNTALGSVDYVADAAMALASCAAGDSYCNKALSDLSGKNQAAADSVKALMSSDTWSAMKETVVQASEGNQAALEATGGMIAGIILPGKKVPNVVKATDPTIKIAIGVTVGEFEKSLAFLSPRDRVAMVKGAAPKVAAANGMVKDNKLTKLNNRDVYRGLDGNLYALDTQHGRFEVVTPKGKHLGEVDFSMQNIPKTIDKSGGHDLKVK